MSDLQQTFSLRDQTVLITGATGLLGESFCRGFYQSGANVIVSDVSEDKARALSNELGGNALGLELDITDEQSIDNCLTQIKKRYETLDVLVNNAYPRNQSYGQEFEEVSIESWNENVSDHLGGYFHVSKKTTNLLSSDGGGSIINMGSIYGIQGPDFSLYEDTDMTSPVEYSAIKGGVVNLTRYLASYLGPDDIRVNCVSPGGIFDDQPESFVERYEDKTVLGRMANPDDVTGAVVYLASDAASYITGHNLVVDGGLTIK